MITSKLNNKELQILSRIGKIADANQIDAYAIGGFVRDKILQRPSKDIDIVVVGSGIELAQSVADNLKIKNVQIFKRFGTAMIKHNDFEIEFVGARKESYSQDSRNPVVEKGTLEDDQRRRDFTINALAISINGSKFGEFLDPFEGMKHMEQKLIKTPLNPDITFSDDPLRMMRAIRFATQLNFKIDPGTFDAVKRNKKRIDIISQERITIELEKILMSKIPSVGFKLLFDSGLLALIFPKLAQLYGVEVRDNKGHKDNFYHTLEVVDNISMETNNVWLRWAALLHDIAKPPTKRYVENMGWTFHGHEVLGARWIPKIFKKLKLPLDHKMKYVQKLVRLHLRPISLTKENITDSAIRRLLFDAGEDIDDLMTLCKADITSKNPNKVKRYKENYKIVRQKLIDIEEKDRIRNWQPPISGELIMQTFGIPPSKKVGDIKTAIREAILEGDIPNDFDAAKDYMMKVGAEMGLIQK